MKMKHTGKRPEAKYKRVPLYSTLRITDYSGFTKEQSPKITDEAISRAKDWVDKNEL